MSLFIFYKSEGEDGVRMVGDELSCRVDPTKRGVAGITFSEWTVDMQ